MSAIQIATQLQSSFYSFWSESVSYLNNLAYAVSAGLR